MADLDEIKIVIRSILISSPRRMFAEDLRREYRSIEGFECPYEALGYRNWLSFLQSIPDTLKVLPGAECVPVVTKETSHIQRLVALSKKPKVKSRRSQSASAGYGRSSTHYKPGPSSTRSYSSYRPSSYSSSSNCPPRSTSSSHHSSYSRSSLPYSSNIEEHFRKARQAKEEIRRQELVTSNAQFTNSSSGNHRSEALAPSSGSPVLINRRLSPTSVQSSQTFRAESVQSRRMVYVPERESSDDSDDSFYERFKDDVGNERDYNPKTKEAPVSKASKSPDLDELMNSGNINDTLRNNIRSLLKSHPNGIWASCIPAEYEKKFKVNLNWSELGYDSVVQMAHDMRDVIVCKRLNGGDWRLFDANVSLPKEYCNNEVPTVSEALKTKIYNIAKKFESGIQAFQLAQLFEEQYNKSLCSEAPGFKDVESILKSIQDSIILLRYIRKECYVYPAHQPVELPAFDAVQVDIDVKKELGLYPEEVLGPHDNYQPLELSEKLQPAEYMELKVAEIYNPHYFYVFLREHSVSLNKLMDELQDFYHDHGAKYVMPNSIIIPGQCCAAIFESEWHRAKIKSVGSMVEVFYVDYGTVSKVPPEEIRFIHRDFCSLPALAIRASMAGIKPPNGQSKFTMEASKALLQLVTDKDLIGLIQRIDRQAPFVELFLIDTTVEPDIHLNDVLVEKNYAVYEVLEENEPTFEEPTESTAALTSPSGTQSTNVLPDDTPSQMSSHHPPAPNSDKPAPVAPQKASSETSSTLPPPGFLGTNGITQMSAPGSLMGGFGAYAPTNVGFNPLLNPALAAYYAACMPQVNLNAALLLQQQQQQQQAALLYAYYQQSYYQQSAASALSAQALLNNSTAQNPFNGSQSNSSLVNSNVKLKETVLPSSSNASCQRYSDPPEVKCATEIVVSSKTDMRSTPESQLKHIVPEGDSSSDESALFDQKRSPKRKVLKKKKKKNEKEATNSKGIKLTHSCDDKDEDLICFSSNEIEIRRKELLGTDGSSSSGEDIIVEHLDELRCHASPSSPEPCIYGAPDLVQSVATLNVSGNFWKVIEITGKSFHLFNVDQKPYVSTGELAVKFTPFSTRDTLLRVLKGKDISIPFKRLNRPDHLMLFVALDSFSEDMVKGLDLSRNKNGSIMNLHLTHLDNVPSILINVNVDYSVVKEFQQVRSMFNPEDKYWKQ